MAAGGRRASLPCGAAGQAERYGVPQPRHTTPTRDIAWNYLACTEVIHLGSNNVTDFFPPSDFSLRYLTTSCYYRTTSCPGLVGWRSPRLASRYRDSAGRAASSSRTARATPGRASASAWRTSPPRCPWRSMEVDCSNMLGRSADDTPSMLEGRKTEARVIEVGCERDGLVIDG